MLEPSIPADFRIIKPGFILFHSYNHFKPVEQREDTMHFTYFLLPLSVLGLAHRRPINHNHPSITFTPPVPSFTPSFTPSSLFPLPSHVPVEARQVWENSTSAVPVFAQSVSSSEVPSASLIIVTYTIGDPIPRQSDAPKSSLIVSPVSSLSSRSMSSLSSKSQPRSTTLSTSTTKPTSSIKAATKASTKVTATAKTSSTKAASKVTSKATTKATTTAKAVTKATTKPTSKATTTKPAAKVTTTKKAPKPTFKPKKKVQE
ncbi:hypothetical protein F5Y05DRAFT_386581 [Hypoxylon sp. FL0543]|nr:hypothetical protein F5Y05DRAFT_386581 [Hypoxylon sp. FL0543]